MNFWDELMGDDEGASRYMESYGEGPGCDTRKIIGSFINDGESVLDVGCGPGWNLDHFKEYGPDVTYRGEDYSTRFVRVSNKRAVEKYGQKHFFLGDCRKLEHPNNAFDVVILQDVLEHTNGYKGPLNEALRVAKKRVIISFWKAFRDAGTGDQINDDGKDGYGATYEQKSLEEFLDSLKVHWMYDETDETANRQHYFYILDKEEQHGKKRTVRS